MELSALQKTGPRQDIGESGKMRDTKGAANEFEAMLIGQLMTSAFTQEEGDSGSQTMLDFGREHLARVIAEGGGLGLGKLIESGLKR
jgi:hypothetical protein